MLTGLAEEDIEICNTGYINVWKFASVNLPSEILKTDLLKKRDTHAQAADAISPYPRHPVGTVAAKIKGVLICRTLAGQPCDSSRRPCP